MPDCRCGDHCGRLDGHFDTRTAERDLREYRRHGPDGSTRLLIDALRESGIAGRTLLDIGGGIGAISLELLLHGLASAVDVDASGAYIAVARSEAEARGLGDRVRYRQGDFVALSTEIDAADVVTLDRVICCYPDLDALAATAAAHATARVGLVHPHDGWWMRLGMTILNVVGRLLRQPRFFVHRTARLEAILREAGFQREWQSGTRLWRVAVYRRVAGGMSSA